MASSSTANDASAPESTTTTPPPPPAATTNAPPTSNISHMAEYMYLPLHRAIVNGDWEKAREIFKTDKDALTAKINMFGQAPLHIAIETCKDIQFVKNLLEEIDSESLPTLLSNYEYNALHYAALVNNTKAAEMLVEKNPRLLFMATKGGELAINKALVSSNIETFQYLFDASKQHIGLCQQDDRCESPFEGEKGALLLSDTISEGLLDVAYDLLKEYPGLATTREGGLIPLVFIAKQWDAFLSGTRYNFFQTFVYRYVPTVTEKERFDSGDRRYRDMESQCNMRSCIYSVIKRIYVKFWKVALLQVPRIKHLQEDKAKHYKALMILKCICEEVSKISSAIENISEHYSPAIIHAVINDTPEVLDEIIKSFPQAIWTRDLDDNIMTQVAIKNRCEKVYNFLAYELSQESHGRKARHDKFGNNLLHLAGLLAPLDKLNLVSGAALQMQRELQWFEEVKRFSLTKDKEEKNMQLETPIMLFRREHTELRKEGEEWMKKTADSYTITATLIITIVFAAAITVPGGNNGDTGEAIYKAKPSFTVFAISDAISLFSSTTSLLLFLSILTARYREEDFLYMLPMRLIIGLVMLFLSVTSMMVAFSATLYLMFGQGKAWILIPIALLTCQPIASFVTLQLPLLFELISSTYGRGIFGANPRYRP